MIPEERIKCNMARIINASIRLFAINGTNKVSVGDIAAEAGIDKETVNTIFESKEAIINADLEYIMKHIKSNELSALFKKDVLIAEVTDADNKALTTDILTGLYNRKTFLNYAKQIITDNPDKVYSIVALDIERFKIINNDFGRTEGDKLLKYIGDKLKDHIKSSYIDIATRTSADNFFVLLQIKDNMIDQIIQQGMTELHKYPLDMKICFKFGIYRVDDITMSVEDMCDRALMAVNSIKGKYNVFYTFYDDSIHKKMQMEQTVINEMEAALANGQFDVYFQPKYDLLTDKIAGAEALVRWIHPKFGILAPNSFIPLFERNGFITKLDMYVWERTCKYIANWKKEKGVSIPVSVNVSRNDIYNTNLPMVLTELVDKYGLKTHELHLEITETAYTEDSNQLIKVITNLKNLGFVIEMDDFGSGYSSLNMISELPIDILKLDMRFVQNDQSRSSKSIMNFVIGLAKWMNLLVVAEGVETQEQINMLKGMECNYVQGYFYSKPIPAEEFIGKMQCDEISNMIYNEKQGSVTEKVDINKGGSDKIILVVDGMQWNCDLVYEYFKNSYSVASTGDGLSALEFVEDNYENIVMVITDLVVPKLSGMDLLIKMKAEKSYSSIPVITTAQLGQGGEEMSLALGAADFIQKPYSKGVMIRRVQNVLIQQSMKNGRSIDEFDDAEKFRIDPATGLLDKDEAQTQIYTFIKKNPESKASFILIDIDNFKQVNDEYGHDEGNKVIRQMVDMLRKSFRKDEIMCHMNGDEFGIFLPEEIKKEYLNERLEDLYRKMQFNVRDIKVSCSIGVCNYPVSGKNFQMIYQNAKVALLEAKASGNKKYSMFTDKM